MTSSDRRAVAGLTLFWIAATITVWPAGDFPLGDDWSYAVAVRGLLLEHRWQLTEFTSMPLGPQVVWGALFCLPRGFSFFALRLSTLVLGWFGMLGIYQLSRECGAAEGLGFVAALTIASTPIYFALSYTFMTDVPFLALTVWGLFFLVRYLKRNRAADCSAALVLLTGATMVRQLGLALAVGSVSALLIARGRRGLKMAIAIPAASAIALALYQWSLARTHTPELYALQTRNLIESIGEGPALLASRMMRRLGQICIYTGTFLFPFVIGSGLFSVFGVSSPRRVRWTAIACFMTVSGGLLIARLQMPLSGNILNDLTLMPIILEGAWNRPRAPWWAWTIVTALGVAGGSAVLAATEMGLTRGKAIDRKTASLIALFAVSVSVYIAPIALSNLYDRYLLFVFVAVMQLLILVTSRAEPNPSLRFAVTALLLLIGGFSAVSMHDTFAFNRARWAAVRTALDRGVPATSVEGGFEVNGWLSYSGDPLAYRAWESRQNPNVIIALAPVPGYAVESTFAFQRWLPWQRAHVLFLRRLSKE